MPATEDMRLQPARNAAPEARCPSKPQRTGGDKADSTTIRIEQELGGDQEWA
jgi:hypothetical protein